MRRNHRQGSRIGTSKVTLIPGIRDRRTNRRAIVRAAALSAAGLIPFTYHDVLASAVEAIARSEAIRTSLARLNLITCLHAEIRLQPDELDILPPPS